MKRFVDVKRLEFIIDLLKHVDRVKTFEREKVKARQLGEYMKSLICIILCSICLSAHGEVETSESYLTFGMSRLAILNLWTLS